MKRRFPSSIIPVLLCAALALGALPVPSAAETAAPGAAGIADAMAPRYQEPEITRQDTPLAATSFITNLALELGGEQPYESPEILTEVDPPVILAAAALLQARENSIFNKLAISRVSDYAGIHSDSSENSELVGKIYNNAAATILQTVEAPTGQWYKIRSGSVTGYIKAEFMVTGADAEELARQVGLVTATVRPESLRLRRSADLGSPTLTVLAGGSSYAVEELGGEFCKISVDSDMEGYVQNDYVDIRVTYDEAISIEEEQAMIAEQERLAQAAREAAEKLRLEQERQAAEKTTAKKTTAKKTTEKTTEKTTAKTTEKTTERTTEKTTEQTTEKSAGSSERSEEPTSPSEEPTTTTEEKTTEEPGDNGSSALRDAIVAEAIQYAGVLKYVLGGNSLETGTDCSGFVQIIYRKFGVRLPRVSADQGTRGEAISSGDMRPGDLVFYAKEGVINHVAIYIGDGLVVHCSTPNSEPNTKISSWNYRAVKCIRNVIGD